jgi:hypothetical protein
VDAEAAAAAERCASVRTSAATTAKPRPCSPARTASTAAFSARMSVWHAIPSITDTSSPAEAASAVNTAVAGVAWARAAETSASSPVGGVAPARRAASRLDATSASWRSIGAAASSTRAAGVTSSRAARGRSAGTRSAGA